MKRNAAPVAVVLKKSGVVPDRVIRTKEVCKTVGLSRTVLHELCAAGKFPARIRLTERAVGWRLSDVMAWIDSRPQVTA